MASTYKYRVLKSSWGVAINITCQVDERDFSQHGVIYIENNLCVSLELPYISVVALEYLLKGIQLVSKQISENLPENKHFVIRVLEIEYPILDYQDEGMGYAIACWAAEEFELDWQPSDVEYDKEANRYIFKYE